VDIYFISLGQTASSGTAGGSYDSYMFNFVKNSETSKVADPVYIPTNNVQELCLLQIFANTWYCQSF